MPSHYTMGGRAGAGPSAPSGGAPLPTPKSLRERFGALRNLPPFLELIWQTGPGLTVADLALRLVRALLPVATLYVGKLIIDEVIRLSGIGGTANAPASLGGWLIASWSWPRARSRPRARTRSCCARAGTTPSCSSCRPRATDEKSPGGPRPPGRLHRLP